METSSTMRWCFLWCFWYKQRMVQSLRSKPRLRTDRSIDKASFSILTQEGDWLRSGIAEAIHIQREAPTLNQGRERHTLPSIYQELLPATHQHTGFHTDPAVLSDQQWALAHWLLWVYTYPANSCLTKTLNNSYQSAGFPCSERKIRLIYFEIFYSILKFIKRWLVIPHFVQKLFF